MQANRCVLYFYFQDMEAEAAMQTDERTAWIPRRIMLAEVGTAFRRDAEEHASEDENVRGACKSTPARSRPPS